MSWTRMKMNLLARENNPFASGEIVSELIVETSMNVGKRLDTDDRKGRNALRNIQSICESSTARDLPCGGVRIIGGRHSFSVFGVSIGF